MLDLDLKSGSGTICQGKTRNKAFTNVYILIFDLQKPARVDTSFFMDTDGE